MFLNGLYLFRWIKFEEDVEEGGNRWSKPFVATLALHSLMELKSYISHGAVILDADVPVSRSLAISSEKLALDNTQILVRKLGLKTCVLGENKICSLTIYPRSLCNFE